MRWVKKHAGKFEELIKGYLQSKEYEALMEKEAMRPEIEELEQYQEDLRIAHGQKPKKVEPTPKLDPDAIADIEAVKSYLKQFLKLHQSYKEAEGLVVQY